MRLAAVSGPLTGQLLDFSTSRDLANSGTVLNGLSSALQLGAMFQAAGSDGLVTTAGVANWGLSEILWVRNASTAIPNGTLVHLDKDFNISAVPNTGLTGRPVYVTLTNFGVGSTIPQGGWVMRSGICPVLYAVTATAGAVYISATAGSATPTNPTGQKQIGNAWCLIAAATTFTRSVTVKNASSQVRVGNTAGIFVGQTVSTAGNTPIPTSTEISAIDPSGQFFTINNSTVASGTATATFTMTGYGIVHIDRPFIMPAVS
jgi:hypothetical protein